MRRLLLSNLLLFLLVQRGQSWFSCNEVEYCPRIRNNDSPASFYVDGNLQVSEYDVNANLVNSNSNKRFQLSITSSTEDTIRLIIDDPDNPRHRVSDALDGDPQLSKLHVETTRSGYIIRAGVASAEVENNPFKLKVTTNGQTVAELNSNGRLVFEESEPNVAVSLDIWFPNAKRAYGLPSHGDRLPLRTTKNDGRDPYRFYNIDHAAYDVNDTQALYGTVPVLYAFSKDQTTGAFWLNSAQTFVDIDNRDDGVYTHFFSESGVIDVFVFVGPTFRDAVKQYATLTGVAPLPPYFTLGYHQSRYSYMSRDDLETVVREFDNHDFPLDTMWLDIDYTDAKKYFTWHPDNFRNPLEMLEFLESTGRHLVVIIDPHIYVQQGYFVWDEAESKGYFVKNSNGDSYQANCWPGTSSWIDFFDPEARDYWASLFAYDKFEGTTNIVHIWNDMNEPAVFGGYEASMEKDNIHYGGWLHRDVHNQYGFYQTMATHQGLLQRDNYQQRPFVLTRSHFAGSQRYTAVWTGDNRAEWNHLSISIPMCLSSALGGISFCGADVGGFVWNVGNELLTRWYQVGPWLPFFRQHSTSDVDRREPYLYDDYLQNRFRKAIQLRYLHLPYWYTLFYEHYRTGEPVIKPLIFNYPDDENLLDNDVQWLAGDNILPSPVILEWSDQHSFYLPGGSDQYWYDVENTLLYRGTGWFSRNVDYDDNVYFYRGGSIVPRRDTIRSSSEYTHDDPINLYVFLDSNNEASGTLYYDDRISLKYQSKEYNYVRYTYSGNQIYADKIDQDANYDGQVTIGNIIVYRPPSNLKTVTMQTRERGEKELNFTYNDAGKMYVTIENLNIDMREPFTVKLL